MSCFIGGAKMAIHRTRLFLASAGACLSLVIVAAISGPFTGVTVANASIADDDKEGGAQSSNAAQNKPASRGGTSQPQSISATANQKAAPGPKAADLPAPPATWQEHCFEHRDRGRTGFETSSIRSGGTTATPR
jgi:hypothetical protein